MHITKAIIRLVTVSQANFFLNLPSTVHPRHSPTLVQFFLILLLHLQIFQIKDSYAYKTGYYPSWIILLLFTKISNCCLFFPGVTKKDWGGHIWSSERLFIKFPRDISIGGLITTSKLAFNSFIRAIRSIHVVQIKPKTIKASTTSFTTSGEIAPTSTSSNFVQKKPYHDLTRREKQETGDSAATITTQSFWATDGNRNRPLSWNEKCLLPVSVRGSENVAYLGSLLLRVSFPRRDFTVFKFLYGLELAFRLTILCVDRVCHAYAATQAWKYKLKRGKRH